VTDRRRCGEDRLIDAISKCLDAGLDAVMLREKDLPGGPLLDMALELRRLTAEHRAALIVNDRVDVAIAAKADAVQLGTRGFKPEDVRDNLPEGMLIGASAHNLEEAMTAQNGGANYVVVSPVFSTSSKPGVKPMGLDELRSIVGKLGIPAYALGGVTAENAGETIKAGVEGVAVISAILDQARPEEATGMLLESIRKGES